MEAAKVVVAELESKRTVREVSTWWKTSSPRTFTSPFLGLLQRFVNKRSEFQKELQARKPEVYSGFTFTNIPFISTTKKAERSAKYALNEVSPTKDHIDKLKDLPSDTLVGKLFVYLFETDDLRMLKAEDIRALTESGSISGHPRYSKADKEITFPGYIPKENRVDSIPAKKSDSVSGLADSGKKSAKAKAKSKGEDIIPWD